MANTIEVVELDHKEIAVLLTISVQIAIENKMYKKQIDSLKELGLILFNEGFTNPSRAYLITSKGSKFINTINKILV